MNMFYRTAPLLFYLRWVLVATQTMIQTPLSYRQVQFDQGTLESDA